MIHEQEDGIYFAKIEDAPAIRAIMEEAVRLLPQRDWFIDDPVPFIEEQILRHGYILCMRTGQRDPAGYLMVRRPGLAEDNLGRYLDFPEEKLNRVSHIESTAVLPDCRGQGIFYRLLEYAAEIEKKAGYHCLMATAHPDNIYSVGNLQKAGFQVMRQVTAYGSYSRLVLLREV